MIRSVLIANRGEIARRIIRTARRMGLRSIAVHSDADAQAAHVREADLAIAIGPAPARESYLRIDRLIEAARMSGADAVHPGYGFLSENADFAEAVIAAGLVFIGPSPASIRAMGSKSAAKALMEKAGVPLLPGYHGSDQSFARLAAEAERIGYPLLVKAAFGGGGRGMRIVREAGELEAALTGAAREAKAAFGDGTLLIERYLEAPRHIEAQILADQSGKTLFLFERDCSVQRRHQKVIEEAPAPGLSAEERAALGAAAIKAARSVDYVGAGTVEFLYDQGQFHFMEMNTRLQVEHPVSEAILGLDLVEWQLKIAAGETLPFDQADLRIQGHAIEARLYAEDPARNFLPQTGRLDRLRFPEPAPGDRIDTGVGEGDAVTPFYDPMIAKLIAHGRTRDGARAALARVIAATEIAGVVTNARFLHAILSDQRFAAGGVSTRYLAEAAPDLFAQPAPGSEDVAIAALLWLDAEDEAARRMAAEAGDPSSPWAVLRDWRIDGRAARVLAFTLDGGDWRVTAEPVGDVWRLGIGEQIVEGRIERIEGERLLVALGDRRIPVSAWAVAEAWYVLRDAVTRRIDRPRSASNLDGETQGDDVLRAPMPGRIVAVAVEPGATVAKGTVLVTIEAMKMEHRVTAPIDAIVEAVRHAVGDLIEEGAELAHLKRAEPAP